MTACPCTCDRCKRYEQALQRIAELESRLPATSASDWGRRVRLIARKALGLPPPTRGPDA